MLVKEMKFLPFVEIIFLFLFDLFSRYCFTKFITLILLYGVTCFLMDIGSIALLLIKAFSAGTSLFMKSCPLKNHSICMSQSLN